MSFSSSFEPAQSLDEDLYSEKRGFTLIQPEGFFGKFRWVCGYAVNHPWVEIFLFGCILVNCVIFAIGATDLVYNNPDAAARKSILDSVDFVILIIFTVESGLQLIYHGFRLFKDPWLSFDFFLVVLSWITENLPAFKHLNIRGLRVLRALRLFRVGPIRELLIILTNVIPKLSLLVLLIALLLYIFAVLFTNLFKDVKLEENYFSRLDYSLFTLLQMMTMDFSEPMRETMKVHSWAWIPFVLFILVMGFLMFNLMVAVVCDAVGSIGNEEDEAAIQRRARQEARYKVYCASKMMSDVIIIQQHEIEEHLNEVTQLLLKREHVSQKEIRTFLEGIIYSSMKKPAAQEISHKTDGSQEDFKDNPKDEIFVPSKYLVKQRILCGKLVNSFYVQNFIIVCIVLNCSMMGLGATDLKRNPDVVRIFEIIDRTFLIIYTVESAMTLFYRGYRVYQDAWATFDLLIVFLSWALERLAIVRGFRVIRAIRVTIRVGPMKEVLSGFFSSVARTSAVVLLSLLMIYIFAILFTQLYMDLELSENYYTRLDFTFFTLLQMMTLDFASPMRETMETYPNAWMPHVIFVVFLGLLVFNLMAAVVCDTIQNGDKEDEIQKTEEISKLSFQLRCVGFQVSILTNSNQCLHEHLSSLSHIVQTQKKNSLWLSTVKKEKIACTVRSKNIRKT